VEPYSTIPGELLYMGLHDQMEDLEHISCDCFILLSDSGLLDVFDRLQSMKRPPRINTTLSRLRFIVSEQR
jgi:hypothetical protein